MKRKTLLFNHTHTPHSNRFEEEVRDVEISSHAANYLEISLHLPDEVSGVFVKTDHWKTDPDYFDELESRVNRKGGSLERFDSHVSFTIGDSVGVVINGVETSVKSEKKHLTVGGIPLDDEGEYYNLSIDELADLGSRSEWIAPAHIGMPFHHMSNTLMDEIISLDGRDGIQVGLGYSTGYFPSYNRIARNEVPFRISVEKYANEYGIPLLPELDLHASLPEGLSGCGILKDGAIERFRQGEFPVKAIFNSDLFRPKSCRKGVTFNQFLQTYAPFVPFYQPNIDYPTQLVKSIPNDNWLKKQLENQNTVVDL